MGTPVTYFVLLSGFARIAIVAIIVLLILHWIRRSKRARRSWQGDPRQCPMRDCQRVNSIEARFCPRCGARLMRHRMALKRSIERDRKRAAA